jgi:hypothetical protein
MSDKKEEIQKARKLVREELGEKLVEYKLKGSLIKAALVVLEKHYDFSFEGFEYKEQVDKVARYFGLDFAPPASPLDTLKEMIESKIVRIPDAKRSGNTSKKDETGEKKTTSTTSFKKFSEDLIRSPPFLKGLKPMGKISLLGGKPLPILGDHKRQVEAVFKELLGFRSLPYKELKKLTAERINELRRLNELVLWYEKDGVIKKYLARESNYSGSHEARTKLDFYHRSLRQRQHYIDELVGDLEAAAIRKATVEDAWSEVIVLYYMMTNITKVDSPVFQNCDYRKIDKVLHRLDDWNSRKDDELRGLYDSDKAAFYGEVLKSKSLTKKIEEIQSMAENLPVSSQRRESLATLNSLYQDKKYLAVYALALPQVEGVFVEMMDSFGEDDKIEVNGTKVSKAKMKALPDKAMFVSRKIAKTDFLFDYFIYCLPEQRNRFSHTGLSAEGEDEKIMCYDIITDLYFVFLVFSELDNPLVHLKKITLTSPSAKTSFSEVVEFMKLSEQAKKHEESYDRVSDCCAIYLSVIQDTPAIRERLFREALSHLQATLNRVGFFAEERYGEGKGLAYLLKKEKTDTSLRAELVKYLVSKEALNDLFDSAIDLFVEFKADVAPTLSDVEETNISKFEDVRKSVIRIRTILRKG